MSQSEILEVAWIEDGVERAESPLTAAHEESPAATRRLGGGVAVACLEVVAAARSEGAGATASRILFWETVWPLLENAAIEFRWLGYDGYVRAYVLVRCAGYDREHTVAEVEHLAADVESLLRRRAVGVELVRVAGAKTGFAAALPFHPDECGELIRKSVATADDEAAHSIPLPTAPSGAAMGLLLEEMAASEGRVCVSLAACPADLDSLDRAYLEGALERLEREARSRRYAFEASGRTPYAHGKTQSVSLARLDAGVATLARRVASYDRLGRLRLALASEGPMPRTLRAAAQFAFGGLGAGSLEYLPAAEAADRAAFLRNLHRVGFELWGPADPHRTTGPNEQRLASLAEVALSVWLPPLTETTPTAVRLVDPAPRRVPAAVPDAGVVLGRNFATAAGRTIALSEADRARHCWILGQTGSGKSTLTARMALHDIHEGRGVCVIDPHGDLVDAILDRYPEERADDLLVFDPQDECPVGMNIFEARTEAERDLAIQQIISILYRLYDPNRQGIMGPRFEHMLRNSALTVMADPGGGTFLDVPLLFTSPRILKRKLIHVTDPVVRSFWLDEQGSTSDFHKSEVLGWALAKFSAFLTNATMRRLLGQRRSALDFRRAMDDGKVVLIKLAKGQLGELNSRLLGMLLVSKLQMATLSRADLPPQERRPFHLYVDEFQALTVTNFDELIAEARKYGLALTLINQHVHQLPEQLRTALFGNVGTVCIFRLGMADAMLVGSEFTEFEAREYARLENYRCVVRMPVDGRVQTPFDAYTLPLEDPEREAPGWRRELEERSRKAHGTPAALADEEALRIFRTDEEAAEDGRATEFPV